MHVIVTGGSSGIGLEVARLYAARGARLTLIARDMGRLERARAEILSLGHLEPDEICIASADVGSQSELSDVLGKAEAALGPCEILVASAGTVEPAAFDDLSHHAFAEQVNTNLIGTANAVRAVYPGMKSRGRGKIMVVSSGAALIGIHGYTAYCASKSALSGFVEALSAEAAPFGIRVSVCFPPDTFTPQFEKELPKRSAQAQLLMGKASPWTAQAVAHRIVRGIDRGSSKLYFGFSITSLGMMGPVIKPVLLWWYGRRLKAIR